MIHKQIEDMAREVEEATRLASRIITEETYSYVKANHRYNSKEDFHKAHSKTASELVSEHLYNAGYRRITGDVVKTIAEEILEMAECYGAGVLFWKKMKKFAIELKKNCTEGE